MCINWDYWKKLGFKMMLIEKVHVFIMLSLALLTVNSYADNQSLASNQAILLSNSLNSVYKEVELLKKEVEIAKVSTNADVSILAKSGEDLESRISRIEGRIKEKHQSIEVKLSALEKEYEKIYLTIPDDTGLTISSVILTSVAVLVTILGVMIAILSVFGYRDLKDKASEVAQTTSITNTEDYLNNNLENAVEQGIVSVFESEKLDHKITEIFLKVAMQGISTSREDNMGED